MVTTCDINDKLISAGLGGALRELGKGADLHKQGNGHYFSAPGHLAQAPNQTNTFVFEVFRTSPTDAMIIGTDTHAGHHYLMAQHGGTWTTWKQMSTDLSNYYTKPQTNSTIDGKINAAMPSNAHLAQSKRNGTIRVRLSGTTLYMTNNGHNA